MTKKQKSLWSQLCDAMDAGDRVKAEVVAAQMTGDEAENAKRWLNGQTVSQKRESAERQRAINSTTDREIRKHCQFDGLM